MARTAEVVTLKGLNALVATAQAELAKAEAVKKVALTVEKTAPDAFKMLNDSVTVHEAAAFAALRKVVVKVVAKLDETPLTVLDTAALLTMAAKFKLFPQEEEKVPEKTK